MASDLNLNEFNNLIEQISDLPKISSKHAKKIVQHLMMKSDRYVYDLIDAMKRAKLSIKICRLCQAWSNDSICNICSDDSRNQDELCIISFFDDLNIIEEAQAYNGKYFILNHEISSKNKKIIQEINFDLLLERIEKENIKKVVIATNFTQDGQTTANYIQLLLANYDLSIYRLGMGLPYNSSIDYADTFSLKSAFENKKLIKEKK
ncbi:recombination mediator RecR [Mycoplasma bradburyae]|uniref:recombination mediator RecR n=1 Tax=Mycoplasma bradburyae TaxID=2963128 RepID=UPI00234156D5|nr:recombination mediator RecR [Mycoplasma bradburyae]MDC4163573.1 recombination mediator RecR [Mycoplasma bradburyae]MDC4184357.1 recombination mediator RecR [Mycoplasma bradburyae]